MGWGSSKVHGHMATLQDTHCGDVPDDGMGLLTLTCLLSRSVINAFGASQQVRTALRRASSSGQGGPSIQFRAWTVARRCTSKNSVSCHVDQDVSLWRDMQRG